MNHHITNGIVSLAILTGCSTLSSPQPQCVQEQLRYVSTQDGYANSDQRLGFEEELTGMTYTQRLKGQRLLAESAYERCTQRPTSVTNDFKFIDGIRLCILAESALTQMLENHNSQCNHAPPERETLCDSLFATLRYYVDSINTLDCGHFEMNVD